MSRGARWFLAAVILLLIWMMLSGWDTDTEKARVGSAVISGFMALIMIGLVAPRRGVWALRLVAGIVALTSLAYFISQVAALLRGERQEFRIGQPSAVMAGLGLLVYGVPALIFALGAKRVGLARLFSRKEPASDAHHNQSP